MFKSIFTLTACLVVLSCTQQRTSSAHSETPTRQSYRNCDQDPPANLSQLTLTELTSDESNGARLHMCLVVAVESGQLKNVSPLKGDGDHCDTLVDRHYFRIAPVFGIGNELSDARDRQSTFEPRINRKNFQFFSFIMPESGGKSCVVSPVLRPGVPYVTIEKDSELVSAIPYIPGVTPKYFLHFGLDVAFDESELAMAYALAIEAEDN